MTTHNPDDVARVARGRLILDVICSALNLNTAAILIAVIINSGGTFKTSPASAVPPGLTVYLTLNTLAALWLMFGRRRHISQGGE